MRTSRTRAIRAAVGTILLISSISFVPRKVAAKDGPPVVSAAQANQNQGSSAQRAMEQRGERVMGFSQNKTAHHFLLTKHGGAIEVRAENPKDMVSQRQIRIHLRHIAAAFANGDFTDPMEVHAQIPPGVPTMKRLKSQIQYRFAEVHGGGRARIHSDNA